MRIQWRMILATTGTMFVTVGAGIGAQRTHSKPKVYCGIPGYDYQQAKASAPVIAVSQKAILVLATNPPNSGLLNGERVKFYNLVTNKLVIDHCSISRFALVLHSDGRWDFSLQADQNPRMPDLNRSAPQIAPLAPLPANTKQTLQIKRNLFLVEVRGYAGYSLVPTDPINAPGKAVMINLPVDGFWVQNGQPLNHRGQGQSDEVRRYFDVIDRIELEFRYR